jgi:hypothetical protein
MYAVNVDIDPLTIYGSVKGFVVSLIESTSTLLLEVDAKRAVDNIIVKVIVTLLYGTSTGCNT